MKFNAITDLNSDELYSRARREAELIYKKSSTRRNRSLEEIIETTIYGHAAELYLIKHHGFVDDIRDYKDLFDLENNSIEIKVTSKKYFVPYVLSRCNGDAKEVWKKYPKILYIFIGNKKTNDYYLEGIYEWNGRKFILQKQKNDV
jgi:hypothetical protein